MSRRVLACLVAVTGAALAAALGVMMFASPSSADDFSVTRVIDGSTVEVRAGESMRRVRLLNIDVPTVGEDSGDRSPCLAREATTFVADLVVDTDTVTLEYGDVRTDDQGLDLAHVRLADDRLISAEIARAGLGAPARHRGGNAQLDVVEAATREAAKAGRGFFDPDQACTPAAQVSGVADALARAEKIEPGSGVKEAEAAAAAVAEIVESQATAAKELSDASSLGVIAFERAGLGSRIDTARAQLKKIASMKQSLDDTVDDRKAAAKAKAAARRAADAARTAQQSRDADDRRPAAATMRPDRPRTRQEDLSSLLNSQ